MPLYLHTITRILRELRIEQQKNSSAFNYAEFRQKVNATTMSAAQQGPLTQRLDTLESFMPTSQTQISQFNSRRAGALEGNKWEIEVFIRQCI